MPRESQPLSLAWIVQLKQRHDLVPNLVAVAKAYLKHEHDTLEAVTRARADAVQASAQARTAPGNAAAMGALSTAEGALGSALGRLMVLTENYPELKAQASLAQLSEDLRESSLDAGYDAPLELASDEDSDFVSVRAALAVLRNARPKRQRQFLTACELVMVGNGALSLEEAELFRAIVVSHGVPLPPRAVAA